MTKEQSGRLRVGVTAVIVGAVVLALILVMALVRDTDPQDAGVLVPSTIPSAPSTPHLEPTVAAGAPSSTPSIAPPTSPPTPTTTPPSEAPAAVGAARGSVLREGEEPRSGAPAPSAPAGTLDAVDIRAAISAAKPSIAACYEGALAHDPDLSGSVVVEFTIEAVDGGGQVSAGEVNQTDMNAPFFEACVLKTVVDVPFPAPEGGGTVKVSYPFRFESHGHDE